MIVQQVASAIAILGVAVSLNVGCSGPSDGARSGTMGGIGGSALSADTLGGTNFSTNTGGTPSVDGSIGSGGATHIGEAGSGGHMEGVGGAAASGIGGTTGGTATGTCHPADQTGLDTPLTICTQTSEPYPGETVPACGQNANQSDCPPQQMGTSAPQQRCGPMIGCALERNQAIAGTVQTTYTPGSPDYTPPEPPHDNGADPISPMGTWMHAESTAWFARPASEQAQTIRNTDQPGSCGIVSSDLMILAIPTPQFGQNANPSPDVWNLAYWCGACAEVVGPSGKRTRVQVVTQRAYDGDGNFYSIDLPGNQYPDTRVDTPFSVIDDGSYCRYGLAVDWRIVPCEVCGGIVLSYVPGYNAGTPAFRILNHRLPIVDAYYMTTGGSWQRLQRDSVNQYHTGAANPMRVRIVAIDGGTIEGSFPPYESGKSYEATSQF
jgi:hypothetical protein